MFDWNIWGPLVGAILGVIGTSIYNTWKHRDEILHTLRVGQFEAVKQLAIQMQKEVLFNTDGTPYVNVADHVAIHERFQEGLPKIAPLISLTEYSLIDREVLVQWKNLHSLVSAILTEKSLESYWADEVIEDEAEKWGPPVTFTSGSPLPPGVFERWAVLSVGLEELVVSARNAVIPPRSSIRNARYRLSHVYDLHGPRGRVANFFWRSHWRVRLFFRNLYEKTQKRKTSEADSPVRNKS